MLTVATITRTPAPRIRDDRQMLHTIARLGGLAARRQLAELGFGRQRVNASLRRGELLPVRAGWVGLPSANRQAVSAVLHGARLTAHTALRSYGVWNAEDLRLHEQVRPNRAPVPQRPLTPLTRFEPPRFGEHSVVRHWAAFAATPASAPAWRVGLLDALVRFARCETDEQVIAAIESAVKTGGLSRAELPLLFARLSRRQQPLASQLTFLADSGLESLGRIRLEGLGLRLEQQVVLHGRPVDLLIDGWLVVEFDGDEFHAPVTDRIRTNGLVRAGFRVLRFGQIEVLQQWDAVLATILEMVRLGPPPPARAQESSRNLRSRRRISSISR